MSQFDPFRQQGTPLPASGAAPQPPQYPAAYPVQPTGQPSYPQPIPVQPLGYGQPNYQSPNPVAAPIPLPAQPVPAPLRPMPIATGQPGAPQPVNLPSAVPTPAARPLPVQAAARPIPATAAVRPVLVTKPVQEQDAAKLRIDDKPTEEEEAPTEKAVKGAPPWLVSTVVHMALIIVLALIGVSQTPKNQISLESVYAEKLGEQTLDDTLQSADALNMEIEVPALAFDSKLVDDPFAAPPQLDMLSLDATKASSEMIEAPTIGLALSGREAGAKKALLGAYGGNATTEEAVRMGLEWLKRNQLKDGSWSIVGPYDDGGVTENKVSATAMALLAFQGGGHTHLQGDFEKEVEKGWAALLKMQNADGFFVTEAAPHHELYAQAQATIALCEIFGMTKDEKFKKPAQLALDFAHKAQAPEGGWRYQPRVDSDVSVTGWYVMALQSGIMAGLEVQSPSLDKINRFLDKASAEGGSRYCYQIGREQTLTMTAEGLLCRQYLGWKHDDPRLQAGMGYVVSNPINYDDQNVYYWYYATQAAHHMDGDHWNRWNAVMRQAVPTAQTKTGAERGSWSPSSDRWGSHGGRLYTTCLSIYMLEVYYRHLPIYKYRLE